MASLRETLRTIGVSGSGGLRAAIPVRPPGLVELVRVANLPEPSTGDLEPDDPAAFESFEVDNPQGLAHLGGDRWILSSESTVRACRIQAADPFRPTGVVHGESRHLDDLLAEAGLAAVYHHIGDLGYADPVVYAPIQHEGKRPPHLLLGLSSDLRVVGYAELDSTTGESACAVNPWNGLLYLPSADASGRLEAYDISAFGDRFARPDQWGRRLTVPRRPTADDIQLRTPDGALERLELQGIVFSANGRIYVTRSLGNDPWNNRIYVYSGLTGRRFGASREWDFNGLEDEIEGIDVHPAGILYVVVADNDRFDTDDFDLYTFRFRSLAPDQV